MRVPAESPGQPEVVDLIAELEACQDALDPAEARYAVDLSALTPSDVAAFYRKLGFRVCSAFGACPEHPLSVFMDKRLGDQAPAV